jgi:signal transduction histidine kinase
MSRPLELGGWVLAIGAIAAAVLVRHRMTSLVDAVARTCHELRGPLTAARLGLVLALRGDQPADSRLRALELDLSRATLAVEDLAHVSTPRRRQAAAGGQDEVDVAVLLAEAVEAWRGLAIAHGAELRLGDTVGRVVVAGERLRLAQAIGNLVTNAVEHGGGLVELGCRVDAASVRIEVVDGGGGLSAPLTELVRCRRHRAGSPRGHGLAIVSEIAAAHGGRLLAGVGDRGARLVLELPRRVTP